MRDPAAFLPRPDPPLDARFRAAAVLLRARWERYNADHGVEYDYDDYGSVWESEAFDEGWSDDDAEDPEVFDDWI